MGELVRFQAAAGPRKNADRSQSAQILLFTGVRYERNNAPAALPRDGGADAPPSGGIGGAGGGRRKRRG